VLDFGDEDCFTQFVSASACIDLDEWFEAPDIDIIIQNNLAEIIIIRI
jgi:hypothetical protein